MSPAPSPFRDYHRARWWVSFARLAAVATVVATALGLIFLVPPATPTEARASTVVAAAPVDLASDTPVEASTGSIPSNPSPTSPGPAATSPSSPEPTSTTSPAVSATDSALAATGPASWSIDIDTTGYQDEIDECLWVRMDLGGHAPFVGAHNYCGGDVVLDMQPGDRVSLAGAGLDGAYVVTDDRDARAGDVAAAAIAGMTADVILQTCYWGRTGSVRLVGLMPAPEF